MHFFTVQNLWQPIFVKQINVFTACFTHQDSQDVQSQPERLDSRRKRPHLQQRLPVCCRWAQILKGGRIHGCSTSECPISPARQLSRGVIGKLLCCPLQARMWTLCIGSTLVFGPILGKTWRLYRVFTQRVPDKRVVRGLCIWKSVFSANDNEPETYAKKKKKKTDLVFTS